VRLKALAEGAGAARVLGFGESKAADARLLDAALEADGSEVRMMLDGRELRYHVGTPGRHWVQNSLAVLATVAALGADPAQAAEALTEVRAPKGRGARHRVAWLGGAIILIDESYNANPASMRAALALLDTAPGRRIAVLGDMLELGAHAPDLHAALAESIERHRVDRVFTAGMEMRHLHDALPQKRRGGHAENATAVLPLVRQALRPGDTVLIKGSLGSAMGPVVEALLADAQTAPAPEGV
jgi:UDP-N-acetylmuramoyl-tripeptide--D-alanyl-D-alanine ligase